jgi:hypothetical protein
MIFSHTPDGAVRYSGEAMWRIPSTPFTASSNPLAYYKRKPGYPQNRIRDGYCPSPENSQETYLLKVLYNDVLESISGLSEEDSKALAFLSAPHRATDSETALEKLDDGMGCDESCAAVLTGRYFQSFLYGRDR